MTVPPFGWPPPIPGSGGGGGGTATELATTGAPVDVSGAAPPVAGQVLTATGAETAEWRVPGLRYDAAIRFNVNASGTATIEAGTWGFVYTKPPEVSAIQIFVVSSLSAPPVDSRFGLYVSPSVTVPVTVSLVGASQIMGLDGTLGPSCELLPGAMYEWVFYHEGGVAIWGLVSDTTHTAQYLMNAEGRVWVAGSGAPVAGAVLTAINDEEAVWTAPTDVTVDRLSTGLAGATQVDLAADVNVDVSSATTVDGVSVNSKRVLLTAQTTTSQNGTWSVSGTGEWNKQASGSQPVLNQFVIVDNGETKAGAIWVRTDTETYAQITIGAPLTGGTGITRTGNAFNLAAHASTHNRGGSDIVAAAKISESSGPTTLDIGAVADGQFLKRSGANVIGSAVTASFLKAQVYRSAALNTHTSGWAKVPMDTVAFDPAGIWNAANTRFIPTIPGYYLFDFRSRRTSNTNVVAGYGLNGALGQAFGTDASALSNGGMALVFMNGTTDYIEPFLFSTTSVAFTTGLVDTYCYIVGPF